MVTDLTGMEIANASLLDEGTAAAEAMGMLLSSRTRAQKKANVVKFFISELCYPQTLEIVKTRAIPFGVDLVIGNHNEVKLDDSYFGCLLQYPEKYGEVIDYSEFISSAKEHEIGVVVAADLLSLSLLTPPGEWGADVVIGTTQRFGIPMGYGGPQGAYFATYVKYKINNHRRIIRFKE